MAIEKSSDKIQNSHFFDSLEFAKKYHYDGNDLGASIHGEETVFKVWAPTASCVLLNLFRAGNGVSAYKRVEMEKGDKGVWSHTEKCGHGTYYTYTVTTSAGVQEAVDPYAKAVGVNGKRGMVIDLSRTDPEGWEGSELKAPVNSYSEAIIWEIHVRDFSNKIPSSKYKGKYLAFTEKGLVNEHGESVGIDYLADLGVTHVHLLPVYDYASVDETHPDGSFNWGYDPMNYNAPEGSYSTDPYRGEVRIRECKEMVKALHDAGIGVIMDMVYNHTYDANGSFNKIVPNYYYRYTESGENTSASGCGNDTASERYMYGKFMVDSCSYWVREYKLDGLRFDLMGLHDLETMQRIESAVHRINPHAVIYGEGWIMGSTIDGRPKADQINIGRIERTGNAIGAVAVFNDVMRDGLKGNVFGDDALGYINGAPKQNFSKIVFGINGGRDSGFYWSVNDSMVINYMSAHDNNTLWDKLLLSNSDADDAERAKMNRLGAAILFISKGTPFFQAGEEMLRTKNGDENSYNSGDEINNIDWSLLDGGSLQYKTVQYYKGLIKMRKIYHLLTSDASETLCTENENGIATVKLSDGLGCEMLIIINPTSENIKYTLDGDWYLIADGERAGSEVIAQESGEITACTRSIRIYINDKLITKDRI